MSNLQIQLPADTWTPATWEDYLKIVEAPDYDKARSYYYHGHMRLEMSPVGFDHSIDHSIIAFAINLFAVVKGIPITMADNCTYRKAGIQECQPDLSCYLGNKAQAIPKGTNIVNLDQYPAPDLIVEVSKTTLLDDLGIKRSLYEDMGVAEYWIVDVKNTQVLDYAIGDRGSHQIDVSQVLPGLTIATLTEALDRSRQTDHSQVGAWLMSQFSQDKR